MSLHNPALRISVFCLFAVFAVMPAWAGWNSQVVLANSAYQGSIAIDSAGNLTSVWFQYQTPSGGAVNQIWASTAAIGHPWSVPVNISGTISVSGGNSLVRTSAAGKATVIYTDPTLGAAFVDHTSGGTWGTPGTTHGVNQFYVSNDNGDDALAWGVGATRAGAGVTSIAVVQRPSGGTWSSAATTIASGTHLNLDGALLAPNGTMAVAWESFDSVCGSRTCKTSNWVLHVSTRAASGSWVDSGALLGASATQHFGQLAGDTAGDLGVASTSGGNLVSLVRHGSTWTGPTTIASSSTIGFNSGVVTQNRVYASDSAGHASFVNWNAGLTSLVAVDGNLVTNTWGTVQTISGADQDPGYFDFTMSASGKAIAFYGLTDANSNTTWRAVTRSGPGVAWNAPATAGTSFEGGGVPESVAVNSAGQAAVLFHGLSADFLTNIEYTNTFQP